MFVEIARNFRTGRPQISRDFLSDPVLAKDRSVLPDADQALTRHREYGANAFHVAERSVGIAGSGFDRADKIFQHDRAKAETAGLFDAGKHTVVSGDSTHDHVCHVQCTERLGQASPAERRIAIVISCNALVVIGYRVSSVEAQAKPLASAHRAAA